MTNVELLHFWTGYQYMISTVLIMDVTAYSENIAYNLANEGWDYHLATSESFFTWFMYQTTCLPWKMTMVFRPAQSTTTPGKSPAVGRVAQRPFVVDTVAQKCLRASGSSCGVHDCSVSDQTSVRDDVDRTFQNVNIGDDGYLALKDHTFSIGACVFRSSDQGNYRWALTVSIESTMVTSILS